MTRPWHLARLVALVALFGVATWLGIKEGIDGLGDAESWSQRVTATTQIGYGLAAVASLWALFARPQWSGWALGSWGASLTATGALAPLTWGGATWDSGALAGLATAAVAGLGVWGAWRHIHAAPGSGIPTRPN